MWTLGLKIIIIIAVKACACLCSSPIDLLCLFVHQEDCITSSLTSFFQIEALQTSTTRCVRGRKDRQCLSVQMQIHTHTSLYHLLSPHWLPLFITATKPQKARQQRQHWLTLLIFLSYTNSASRQKSLPSSKSNFINPMRTVLREQMESRGETPNQMARSRWTDL